MWLDIERKKINLKTYLEETMQGVLYRHLNYILGLRIQLSMTYDQFNSVGLKSIGKKILSIIKAPFLFSKIQKFEQLYIEGNNPSPENLADEFYQYFLSAVNEQLNFMNLLPDEKKFKQMMTEQVISWIRQPIRKPMALLLEIQKIWKNNIPIPRIFTDPEGKIKDYSKKELKNFWMFFFGGGSQYIQSQKMKLQGWNDKKAYQFHKGIKKQTKYPDFVRLQLLEFSSYDHAFVDAVTSFEDWLAFYFGIIVKKQPERFLNTKGIYPGFKKQMKKIIEKYHQSDTPDTTVIQELMRQERLNVGFAGKYLKNYLTEHAKLILSNDVDSDIFEYYNQLRIHRNNLVHPEPLEKSNIPFPRSLDAYEEVTRKLIELGLKIIYCFQIFET